MKHSLRTHQRQLAGVVEAIATGATSISDILCAVTPGGGKSLLPVLAATRLIPAGIIDRLVWIVPRISLVRQAEEAFADPFWRRALGHSLSVRAADNSPDPARGLAGWVTTYQGVAAAPDLHLAEVGRSKTMVVVDEVHHLPALGEIDPLSAGEDATWSRAILPLLETARLRLLLSGTLERADGKAILYLPYRRGSKHAQREVDLTADNLATIGYSRAQALAEKAVLPVRFGMMDGVAEWLDEERRHTGPHKISAEGPTAHAALFTGLRTGFAKDLLQQAFKETRERRAHRREKLGMAPGEAGPGLGKLLVIAPDQTHARRYLDWLHGWMPANTRQTAKLAVSDEPQAHANLAAYRLETEPSILVTVGMAYEGMDCPAVSTIACLTHIRSRSWLEQAIARATRVDPAAGPYDEQEAVVFAPADPMFAAFRRRIEREQGTMARFPEPRQRRLPLDEPIDREDPIVPLASNATALAFETLAPGPDFAELRPEQILRRQPELLDIPLLRERLLRQRIGQMIAAQVVENENSLRVPRASGTHHAYTATLKRIMGKARDEMTLDELEATVAWLERNRIADHLDLLDGDPKYDWTARQKAQASRRMHAKSAVKRSGSNG